MNRCRAAACARALRKGGPRSSQDTTPTPCTYRPGAGYESACPLLVQQPAVRAPARACVRARRATVCECEGVCPRRMLSRATPQIQAHGPRRRSAPAAAAPPRPQAARCHDSPAVISRRHKAQIQAAPQAAPRADERACSGGTRTWRCASSRCRVDCWAGSGQVR